MVRCEVDAAQKVGPGQPQTLLVKALNEYDFKGQVQERPCRPWDARSPQGFIVLKCEEPYARRRHPTGLSRMTPQDYRKRLENQRGAVLLSEAKNNKFKVCRGG